MNACMLWMLAMAAITAPGNDPHRLSGQMALGIIIDTSSSCGNDMANIRALSRQAFTACGPQTYIEILSAHPRKPRIRLAQTIRTGSSQEVRNVTEILRDIHTGFLSGADISGALDLAAKRLDAKQKGYGNVAIMIFTDGQLSDNDSRQVVAISERLQKKGWHVFVTGSSRANRHILIGASENKLTWSLTSEANPVVWLKQVVEENSTKQPVIKRMPQSEVPLSKPAKTSKPPAVAEPKPAATKTEDKTLSIKTRIDSEVSIAPDKESVKAEAPESEDVAGPVVIEPVEEKSAFTEESRPIETPPAIEKKIASAPSRKKSTLITILRKGLPWIVGLAAALLVVVGIAVIVAMRNAGQWQAVVNLRLGANRAKTKGALVVEVNGQKYGLGQFDRFTSANVGSGSGNTVKIPHKSVKNKHVHLFRKSEHLMLKNLARLAVIVNSTEVKPGRKHRLTLPARIKLSDDVQFTVRLVPNEQQSTSNRSTDNEAEK